MDRGKRHSVRDILMIYVLPPFISFSYPPFLQFHFQIIANIYLADFLKTNFFLRSISSKITLAKEKERKIEKATRKKGGREKWLHFKSLCWLLYTEKKIQLGFGGNVFKNPAVYTVLCPDLIIIIIMMMMWSIWNNSYLNCGCRWKLRMIKQHRTIPCPPTLRIFIQSNLLRASDSETPCCS